MDSFTEVRSALEKRIKFIYDSLESLKLQKLLILINCNPDFSLDIDITVLKEREPIVISINEI